MPRVERETAARISEEIGNLMKEIETLVEEKAKESADMSKFIREGADSQEGRWDGDLCVPHCQLTVPPRGWWQEQVAGPQLPTALYPRVGGTHPCVLLIPFVPQVAPWCTKEPVSP